MKNNIRKQHHILIDESGTLPDFVAGAVLAKYNKNNPQFYDVIKDHILLEKIVNWPELKRKSLERK
jgi:hypothetical protein